MPGLISDRLPKSSQTDYGTREDGTPKGNGYFGPLPMQTGKDEVATELSRDSEVDGKRMLYPLLVPTLKREQIDHLLNGGEPTREIDDAAFDHAMKRIKEGKSTFAHPDEPWHELPKGD
jgi:hypothetical protein